MNEEEYEDYIDELRLHGTRELAEEVYRLEQQIERLKQENERLKKLNNEELYRRFKALKYINKNMICDALYPASKVDGENIANILNGGVLNGGVE